MRSDITIAFDRQRGPARSGNLGEQLGCCKCVPKRDIGAVTA
jgi:hypothetical protein